MVQRAKFDEYGTKIVNDRGGVSFMCPMCLGSEIYRSKQARKLVRKYTCSKCGFVGP